VLVGLVAVVHAIVTGMSEARNDRYRDAQQPHNKWVSDYRLTRRRFTDGPGVAARDLADALVAAWRLQDDLTVRDLRTPATRHVLDRHLYALVCRLSQSTPARRDLIEAALDDDPLAQADAAQLRCELRALDVHARSLTAHLHQRAQRHSMHSPNPQRSAAAGGGSATLDGRR
jgi:hypothetical protein